MVFIFKNESAMHVLTKSLFLSQLLLTITGAIELTCETADPLVQSDVTCICRRTSGVGIEWFLDDVSHSSCFLSATCAPQHSGYNYVINKSENAFEITMNSYTYSDCKKVTCKDVTDSTIVRSITPSSLKFDATYPTSLTEPASNNENGVISVTTGCISGFSNVEYEWYIITNNVEEKYTPDKIIDTTDTSTCSNCNTDNNGKRTIGFNHQEASATDTKNVSFRVILSHASTNLRLNLTSSHVYSLKVIQGNTEQESDGWWKSLGTWGNVGVIFCAVFLLIAIAGFAILYSKKPGKVTITSSRKSGHTTEIPVTWTLSGFNINKTTYKLICHQVIVTTEQPLMDNDFFETSSHFTEVKDKVIIMDNIKEKKCTLSKNITMGTYYKITVVPKNKNGNGIKDERYVRTKIVTPKITSPVKSMVSDKILVQWEIPEEVDKTLAKAMQYTLTWKPEKSTGNMKGKDHLTDKKFTIEEDISPGTSYTIEVFAFINNTFGEPGKITITTAKKNHVGKKQIMESISPKDSNQVTANILTETSKAKKNPGGRKKRSLGSIQPNNSNHAIVNNETKTNKAKKNPDWKKQTMDSVPPNDSNQVTVNSETETNKGREDKDVNNTITPVNTPDVEKKENKAKSSKSTTSDETGSSESHLENTTKKAEKTPDGKKQTMDNIPPNDSNQETVNSETETNKGREDKDANNTITPINTPDVEKNENKPKISTSTTSDETGSSESHLENTTKKAKKTPDGKKQTMDSVPPNDSNQETVDSETETKKGREDKDVNNTITPVNTPDVEKNETNAKGSKLTTSDETGSSESHLENTSKKAKRTPGGTSSKH